MAAVVREFSKTWSLSRTVIHEMVWSTKPLTPYERIEADDSNVVPLLHLGEAETNDAENGLLFAEDSRKTRHWRSKLQWVVVLAIILIGYALLSVFLVPTDILSTNAADDNIRLSSQLSQSNASSFSTFSVTSTRIPPVPSPTSSAVPEVIAIANRRVDNIIARQSKTLAQARARYSLKTGREPPPLYDNFYKFATEKKCLIDDYDQVYEDFAPYYQLADDHPKFFKERVDRLFDLTIHGPKVAMRAFIVKDGDAQQAEYSQNSFGDDWDFTFYTLNQSVKLPDMKIVLNGQDEPRIVFNTRFPDSRSKALNITDPEPLQIENLDGTAGYFGSGINGTEHCLFQNSPDGFGDLANDKHAFFISTKTSRFTTDLYPLLSMAKISPCFSDILVPSPYFYSRSTWKMQYTGLDYFPWANKKPVAYWRGVTSGGTMIGENYKGFQRFRLVDLGKAHPEVLDVSFSQIQSYYGCWAPECDIEAITAEYNITGEYLPREDSYEYKYVVDVDGNSFSGRFWSLMTSGSLVFKSTVFTEHHSRWLIPYEHYIPVRPDLSDLVSKINWAIEHDAEARLIQESGKALVERLFTDDQNDCYYLAVLMEYSRLQDMGG